MMLLPSAEKLSIRDSSVDSLVVCPRSATRESTIFVSKLLKAGASPEDIKNLTKIAYQGEFYGYAGHYTVPAQHNVDFENHIYTWFQPCEDCEDITKAPLLLWLQGGPGGPGWFGAFAELGNWYIGGNTSDAEPHKDVFHGALRIIVCSSTNQSTLGFSFQTDRKTGRHIKDVNKVDYTSTSKSAMSQTLLVLLQFYKAFPELKDNKFIIAGESYGGLYTANLGYLVTDYNKRAPLAERINFKSLLVGDPCINWKTQMLTYANTLYGMGVIMLKEREDLQAKMEASVKFLDSSCPKAFSIFGTLCGTTTVA